jgi:hypothetical protein
MPALRRVFIASPNYSSRGGSAVRLIVLHTAEGALTYQSLGNYFASSSSQVSSHVGIDDTPNEIGEYVKPGNKAWTAANANPVAIQAETCAFAGWSAGEWDRHPQMLENIAQWIAEEASRFGIPIVRLSAEQAQGGSRGVCDHGDLGTWGGGHWDVGDGFPWTRVLDIAQGKPSGPTTPTPEEEEDCPMLIVHNKAGGIWLIWGSFRTPVKNPDEVNDYKKAGAKDVGTWPDDRIAKFPIAENAVK